MLFNSRRRDFTPAGSWLIKLLLLPVVLLILGCSPARINALPVTTLDQKVELPERIILNLTEQPSSSQAVTWRTQSMGENPRAEIAAATGSPDFVTNATTVTATSESVKLDDDRVVFSHSVVFKGLIPATCYAYRVGEGELWSEWNQFTTAREGLQPFTFIYFGDPQNQVRSMCSRTLRTAFMTAPEASFWHFVGDLVNNGDKDQEWGELYEALGFIPRVTPMILLPGNHEYPNRRTMINPSDFKIFPLWRPQFTLPENGPPGLEETAYFLDFQGVRFIMLNGNELLEEQAEWLEKILERDPQAWTIAAIHQPIYSTGRRGRDQRRQELFVPVFDRFSVDLVLQGHEHNYARTKPLFNGQEAHGQNRGTVYVTSVSGPKTYAVNSRYDRLMNTTGTGLQLFHVIRVDQNTLTCEGFDAAGNRYDSFELKK